MPDQRQYQGQTYQRNGPGEPWVLVPQQRGVVLADPYRAAAESRAAQDQQFEAERLRIAREREAREAAADQLERETEEERLTATRAEADRLDRAQASGISDALYQMRNVITAAKDARALAASGAGIGSWEGSDGFRDSSILSIIGANSASNDLEALLNTVGSNTAFDRLQKMREESPTGGALGAVSEIELRLLRDSIASLSQRQSEEQFRSNIDRVIAAYTRVAGKLQSADRYYRENGSMEGYTPPSEEELARLAVDAPIEPLGAAGSGATETSIPIPAEMQAEHSAYLRQNWGRLDAQDYTAFRSSLDRKYGFEPNPDAYQGAVSDLNAAAAQGGSPEGLAIPAVNRDLSDDEQARNNFVSNPFGTGVTSAVNSLTFGVPSYLAGNDQLQAMSDLNPKSAFAGDVVGSTLGALATGGALGAGKSALGLSGRLADGVASPLAGDVLYGSVYGAMSDDDPLVGLLAGATSSLVGDQVGKYIGRGVSSLRMPDDPLSAGQRAVVDTVGAAGNKDDVLAALTQAGDLGVPMTLADASPELGSLAGSATRFSPTVGNQARSVMAQRNQGQLDRLAQAVERDLGPVENIPQRRDDLLAQARTNARPLYESAYAAPGASSVEVDDLVERPTFKQALLEAAREAADEGVDPKTLGFDFNEAGDVLLTTAPSWRTLDYTKRGLDNIIESGTSKIDGMSPAARRANEMRKILLGRMDAINPDYKAARSVYAGPAAERELLARGQQSLRTSPEQLGVDMARMTPEQQGQMRLGFQSQTMENAGNLRNNSNPWAQLNTPNTEKRLGVMYGSAEDTDIARLLSQRDLELQLAGNANRLIGNSATAERQIADAFFEQQPGIAGDLASGIIETGALGGPWLTVGKGLADRLWRDRREAAAQAANRRLADDIGPLLLSEVPPLAVDQMFAQGGEYSDEVAALLAQGEIWGRRIGTGVGTATADSTIY